jgi:hypothetical protein
MDAFDMVDPFDYDPAIMEVTSLNEDAPLQSNSRFVPVTEADIQEDLRNRIPTNTQKKAKWAISILSKWHNEWKMRLDGGNKVLNP